MPGGDTLFQHATRWQHSCYLQLQLKIIVYADGDIDRNITQNEIDKNTLTMILIRMISAMSHLRISLLLSMCVFNSQLATESQLAACECMMDPTNSWTLIVIIQGGSWVSTGVEMSRFARFAFRAHFFQHAGFRVARSLPRGNNRGKIKLPARFLGKPVYVRGLGEQGKSAVVWTWSAQQTTSMDTV